VASGGYCRHEREDRDGWMHQVVAAVQGDDAQEVVHVDAEQGLGGVDQSDDDDCAPRGRAAGGGGEQQRGQ
jgi:hypothetical protein